MVENEILSYLRDKIQEAYLGPYQKLLRNSLQN